MHSRTPLLLLVSVLIAGALAIGTSGTAHARDNRREAQPGTITIGFVNWTEDIAVSHLMKALLERKLHYDVKLKLVGVEQAFRGVADGTLDAFLDVWLPSTHGNYWKRYKDRVVDLGIWYRGEATLGIAVPDYVDAESIGDLARLRDKYHGKIIGIQPEAGLMRLIRTRAIPAYGLEDFKLVAGDTSAMIEAVDQAIHHREPIAFAAWKPHWLFSAYPIRYLKDPKHALNQVDHLHAIVRRGLRDDAARAYALLDAFSLTQQQLGDLELAVADARSAYGGVRRWLAGNADVVAPWIAAAASDRRDYLY